MDSVRRMFSRSLIVHVQYEYAFTTWSVTLLGIHVENIWSARVLDFAFRYHLDGYLFPWAFICKHERRSYTHSSISLVAACRELSHVSFLSRDVASITIVVAYAVHSISHRCIYIQHTKHVMHRARITHHYRSHIETISTCQIVHMTWHAPIGSYRQLLRPDRTDRAQAFPGSQTRHLYGAFPQEALLECLAEREHRRDTSAGYQHLSLMRMLACAVSRLREQSVCRHLPAYGQPKLYCRVILCHMPTILRKAKHAHHLRSSCLKRNRTRGRYTPPCLVTQQQIHHLMLTAAAEEPHSVFKAAHHVHALRQFAFTRCSMSWRQGFKTLADKKNGFTITRVLELPSSRVISAMSGVLAGGGWAWFLGLLELESG